jgi:hypothetical protein
LLPIIDQDCPVLGCRLLELEHGGLTSDCEPSSEVAPSNGGNQKSSGQEENSNLVSQVLIFQNLR